MPERKIAYQRTDHQGGSAFVVEAPSLERLYIDAALALSDMLARADSVEARTSHKIAVKSDERAGLMADWLNEILRRFQSENFVCRRVVFDRFDGKSLHATIWGEAYDPIRHGRPLSLKGVQSERLELGERPQTEGLFYAKVFLSG